MATTASTQPTWRFHIAFEDGTGARDTIWMVYDTTATTGSDFNPQVDYALGEGAVTIDPTIFNVWTWNWDGDSTKTHAFPYSWFPILDGTIIDAINWVPPMTIRWDTSLFHAPYLPYAQGSFGIAFMDGIAFSQFDTGLGFGQYNMLTNDSVTIDLLWDFLFPIPVTLGPDDHTAISGHSAPDGLLRTWPNPAHDKIRLRPLAGYVKTVSITDIAGRQTLLLSNPIPSEELDISELPPGRYFIHIITNQNQIYHGTFEKIP
jgi:hypothetical protein